jgi:hypothetical protein
VTARPLAGPSPRSEFTGEPAHHRDPASRAHLSAAFALLMEECRGREVLPIGRLSAARHATHGSLAIQLRDIERQAGVRHTL